MIFSIFLIIVFVVAAGYAARTLIGSSEHARIVQFIKELNAETDFLSRNDKFQDLVRMVVAAATNVDNINELRESKCSDGVTVADHIVSAVASIGENINLRRMSSISVENGVVAGYVHNATATNMGTIVALVALESDSQDEKLSELGKQLAMHIAAAKPSYLRREEISQDLIDNEKKIFVEQTKDSGRPAEIIEKMVEGRIRKFVEEIALLEQTFIMDGKSKVEQVVADLAKTLGKNVKISSFIRFELGDGIETEETNFADEVAKVINQR
jgi:elongation factor Ts